MAERRVGAEEHLRSGKCATKKYKSLITSGPIIHLCPRNLDAKDERELQEWGPTAMCTSCLSCGCAFQPSMGCVLLMILSETAASDGPLRRLY